MGGRAHERGRDWCGWQPWCAWTGGWGIGVDEAEWGQPWVTNVMTCHGNVMRDLNAPFAAMQQCLT